MNAPLATTDPSVAVSSRKSRSESQAEPVGLPAVPKCTSGCPVAGWADIKPHELVRLAQLGLKDESARQPHDLGMHLLPDLRHPLPAAGGHRGAQRCASPHEPARGPGARQDRAAGVQRHLPAHGAQARPHVRGRAHGCIQVAHPASLFRHGQAAHDAAEGQDAALVGEGQAAQASARHMFRRVRDRTEVQARELRFFPGCSMEGTARDYPVARRWRSAKALGMQMPEIPGWTCCGSTAAHQTDPLLAAGACRPRTCVAAAGKTVAVGCAACYSRLKIANHEIANDAERASRWPRSSARTTTARPRSLHLLEILARDIGAAKIAEQVKQPLRASRSCRYYGCLLSRPPEVTKFDDPENPTLMDQVLRSRGRHRPRLAAQDRVLRRQLLHHRRQIVKRAHARDPRHGQGRGRRLHRHRLPAVPAQPGPAPEGHRTGVGEPSTCRCFTSRNCSAWPSALLARNWASQPGGRAPGCWLDRGTAGLA